MTKGFITYANHEFKDVLLLLLEGLAHFSSHPVCVVALDSEIEKAVADFANVISQRRPSPKGSEEMFRAKLQAAVDSPFDKSVLLDADNVPNRDVDALFEIPSEKFHYPLAPRHGCDPQNQAEIMKCLGCVAKTMPYVQANYVFGPRGKEFLAERVLPSYEKLLECPVDNMNYDETVLNVELWKAGAIYSLNSFNQFHETFDHWERGEPFNAWHVMADYYPKDVISYQVFHGAKDPVRARNMLDKLKAKENGFLPPPRIILP